jgi:hypothetical protein
MNGKEMRKPKGWKVEWRTKTSECFSSPIPKDIKNVMMEANRKGKSILNRPFTILISRLMEWVED